ncbi:hypothetical protein N7539_009468 [Penicillium diatomitis]|uniref:Derlin n=1 Tax=Penicillium diatomitis TaxID=2819901 RepID=A0A9W9WKI7_9EURO|nr:uncharacterized protein N7539_009468 [Penicillium diatomitis]KAJ5466739.1 hypothetical protein N7539_009468 [Penicillium diatomitis]
MDFFWNAPPVARTLTAATLIESLLVHGRIIGVRQLAWAPSLIFWKFPPQLWRIGTAFCLTRPDLEFLFDLYNLWRYSSALELESIRFPQPGDFFIYLLFVSTVIQLTAGLYLGGYFFLTSLTMALIWTYAQEKRGTKVTFFVITIPVIYLPAVMLCLTLVRAGWGGVLYESTGILAAHLYHFLTHIYPTYGGGRNYISTPLFVQRFFYKHTPTTSRPYGTPYRPAPSSASQGRASGTDAGARWGSWGSGRRLG